MSETDREKWDARYRAGAYESRANPSALLVDWLNRLPRGRALDVACGAGRNALYLAEAGYRVDAVDISRAGLERARESAGMRGLHVRWLEADLETDPLPAQRYDLILVMRYTHPALMPRLTRRLADGGYLLCEQHLTTTREVVGPTHPAFRVQPGELLTLATDLRVLLYREAIVKDPDGRTAAVAQLVACRGSPGF